MRALGCGIALLSLGLPLISALEAPTYADSDAQLMAAAEKAKAMKQALETARNAGLTAQGQAGEVAEAMMLRSKTAGLSPPAAAVHTPVVLPHASAEDVPEFYPGERSFDAQLLAETDEVRAGQAEAVSAAKQRPRAALAVQSQESQHDRAARYFAVHGMRQVAQALGEEVDSKSTAKKEQDWREKLKVDQSAVTEMSSSRSREARRAASSPWAAVDALRSRAAQRI
mmetsp:Transcript_16043/g.37838  ORF Transcript_16043/g.37838 Transcript_16043/m.37838 type:complete len:227 (+) Transcript_16043:108-788(+)|eukprot:CAMPEP_0178432358 /NCGR_PEP_ID=MMETSP0689_2-20121128/32339_1 /TAXON_ID=160604 /ORGANISM="Amphidinium massartii, Strain CS-259" /LENGTH=226 /DNA_ID=CAMNT_0020054333 /DNA_START=40 /DNA_END=720 /DNA_ORIENTATION=-